MKIPEEKQSGKSKENLIELEVLEHLVEIDDLTNDTKRKELADMMFNDGFYERAVDLYSAVFKTAEEWREVGGTLHNAKEYEAAIICFDKGLSIDSSSRASVIMKAEALIMLSKYKETIACCDAALKGEKEFNSENSDIWFFKGSALYSLGNHEKAIHSYDQVLKLKNNDSKAWFHKGTALIALQKKNQAAECFYRGLYIDPNYSDCPDLNPDNNYAGKTAEGLTLEDLVTDKKDLKGTADFFLEKRFSKRAFTIYEKVLSNVDEWIGVGNKFVKSGDYGFASDCYTEALKLEPDNKGVLIKKGDALTLNQFGAADNYQEAIECYNRAIQINSKLVKAWLGKAKVMHLLNNDPKSQECYFRAEELLRNRAYKYVKQGTITGDSKTFRKSIKFYNKLILLTEERSRLNPQDIRYKGIALYALKKYNKAMDCFSTYLDANHDDAEIWELQGEIHKQLGNKKESKKYFKQAKKLRKQAGKK